MKRFAWLLLVPATVIGCATTRAEAKAAGAAAVGCPIGDVHVTSVGAAQYVVEGCGRAVDVDCQDPRTVQDGSSRSECRAGSAR